jgi:hypothetical protein
MAMAQQRLENSESFVCRFVLIYSRQVTVCFNCRRHRKMTDRFEIRWNADRYLFNEIRR